MFFFSGKIRKNHDILINVELLMMMYTSDKNCGNDENLPSKNSKSRRV